MTWRTETDTLGKVKVPENRLWGAQTQRSIENFRIGRDLMPLELIKALALVKEASAFVNERAGLLPAEKSQWIQKAAREVQAGLLDDHFPLSVWQTGSGTQTNMNLNEVIANRAAQIAGGKPGDKSVHPNDDVNRSQSSNDSFPSAMRIALYVFAKKYLLPSTKRFAESLRRKTEDFKDIIKTGRTHLMDAVPLSLGQEFSAFYAQILSGHERLKKSLAPFLFLPVGGTAVGTGLNSPPDFGPQVCRFISEKCAFPFKNSGNKFSAIASHDDFVEFSGSMRSLAVSLTKIANDIRLLASGPRCGLNELKLPANEPGSSIMPGKVNPTQCEALAMLCAQVMGQDLSVSIGGAGGHLQLNTFKPLIFFNCLRSARLLSDGMNNFRGKALEALEANEPQIRQHLENSLMMVTALNPHIGYERSAKIAKQAFERGSSLKQEAVRLGILTADGFDRLIRPKDMIGPKSPSGALDPKKK